VFWLFMRPISYLEIVQKSGNTSGAVSVAKDEREKSSQNLGLWSALRCVVVLVSVFSIQLTRAFGTVLASHMVIFFFREGLTMCSPD
jgi:hypothetical protein